jgi:hypothetical protein
MQWHKRQRRRRADRHRLPHSYYTMDPSAPYALSAPPRVHPTTQTPPEKERSGVY